MDVKKIIKGVAKFTGKYTLKGMAKGAELLGRGGAKAVGALVKNPLVQTIGTLGLAVVVPEIATASLMIAGIRLMLESLSSKKDMNTKFRDAMNTGNIITRTVGNKIISPLMNRADRGIERVGNKIQDKIDGMFI